jgi:PEP-CTERM motif
MDLKRAWRNGFLVLVIFAIPLSDLYNNQLSNSVADNSTRDGRVVRTESCGTDTPCSNSKSVQIADGKDNLSGVPSTWDTSADERDLTIPENTLADLVPESDHAEFGNIQQALVQFDPQDIFLPEPIRAFDTGTPGNSLQSEIANFGPYSAPGFIAALTPTLGPGAGKSASGGLQNASVEDSENSLIDPDRDSLAQTEGGDPIDNPPDSTTLGTGNDPVHDVPEPSSLMLMTIGFSAATLMYRKSKNSSRFS